MKGDTFLGLEVVVSNEDGAINITGATIELVTDRDRNTLATTITDAAAGTFEIDEQIIDWSVGIYNYKIRVTLPTGRKRTYVYGTITILPYTI